MSAIVSNNFVLDCSLTMTWCFPDEATSLTRSALKGLKSSTALVPSLWPYEVGNILVVAQRRNRISRAQCENFLALLAQLPITISSAPNLNSITHITDIARDYALSVYDAAYLELSLRHGAPIATLDKALRKAAKAAGIATWS